MHIFSQIPILGQGIIIVLMLMALCFAARAFRQRKALRANMAQFENLLAKAAKYDSREHGRGRSLETIEVLTEASAAMPAVVRGWWRAVAESVAPYRVGRNTDSYFLTATGSELLSEDRLIAPYYGGRLQAAVPGLLTSVGLLGTFVAILIGLSGLESDPKTETVRGVSGLVASLSGKFATSVVALTLSVLYILFEHWTLNDLRTYRRRLIAALEATFPTLSLAHVLMDMRSEGIKQAEALGNISSDMASAFADRFEQDLGPSMARQLSSSVGETLGPALGTLGATLERVGVAVEGLAREKQESVVEAIRELVTSIEGTLRTSFEAMGQDFRAALTGSTRDEFTNVARALEGSAGVLQSMNAGFSTMQSTLHGLIEESRRTTELQMSAGSERAESLNRLVESLLVRLNESASQNATHVQGVLAQVVGDLSGRVTALSDDLVAKVGAATAASQAAAADTVRQAGVASAQTADEVAAVIAELRQRVRDFDGAATALHDAQQFVQRTLEQNGAGLRAMQEAAGKVEMLSSTLAGTATAVTRTQDAQLRTAETARAQLAQLEAMTRQHDEILRQYDGALGHARDLFTQLDDRLGDTLDTILSKVQQYNTAVADNFQQVMQHVNGTMPSMGNLLYTATDGLREQVEDLTDVIEQLRVSRPPTPPPTPRVSNGR